MDEIIKFLPSDFSWDRNPFQRIEHDPEWQASGDKLANTRYIISRLCDADLTQVNQILHYAKTKNQGKVVRLWEAQLCVKDKQCKEYTPAFTRREQSVAAAGYLFCVGTTAGQCTTCANLLSTGPCTACTNACTNCFFQNKAAQCSARKEHENVKTRQNRQIKNVLAKLTVEHVKNMSIRQMTVALRLVEMELADRDAALYKASSPVLAALEDDGYAD